MNLKPEQIEEFWKGYGFEEILDSYTQAPTGRWRVPYGGKVNGKTWCYLNQLPIDLNNLWEYAIPKALGILAERGCIPAIMKLFQLWYDELVSLTGDSRNVEYAAQALFQVLWQVKEQSK